MAGLWEGPQQCIQPAEGCHSTRTPREVGGVGTCPARVEHAVGMRGVASEAQEGLGPGF